jgi:hypothetical protein
MKIRQEFLPGAKIADFFHCTMKHFASTSTGLSGPDITVVR